MPPLMTESLSVTSLFARRTDGALSPVCAQSGCWGKINVTEGGLAVDNWVVMKPTTKSFGARCRPTLTSSGQPVSEKQTESRWRSEAST